MKNRVYSLLCNYHTGISSIRLVISSTFSYKPILNDGTTVTTGHSLLALEHCFVRSGSARKICSEEEEPGTSPVSMYVGVEETL